MIRTLTEVEIGALEPERFGDVLPHRRVRAFTSALQRASLALAGRTVWHVNSTARGGGVAEMLGSVLRYLPGGGIHTRWAVIQGADEFFAITKRIHNLLHGRPGDGGQLGEAEREVYAGTMTANLADLLDLVRPGDPVVLHDPQTAGLAPALTEAGADVIWNCHVGIDQPNDLARLAWDFLRPHVSAARAYVFSRQAYVWEGLDPAKALIIPPCIDAFSPKNQPMEPDTAEAVLHAAGVVTDGLPGHPDPRFVRADGTPARVHHVADMVGGPVLAGAPLVTQVSRWDRLKDHPGVLEGFARWVPEDLGAHLVLAGPAAESVTDDPEGIEVLQEVRMAWASLPAEARERVHLACLPMDDLEENAAIVNALQRRSDVVVQKSLAEGFGLTVAEAMWKGRPVVGSRVGGIQDQIDDGVNGALVPSRDLAAMADAVTNVLRDPRLGRRLGRAAHRKVVDRYLAPGYLMRYLELILAGVRSD